MENATKALIIAGSVLIAVVIIVFGVRIFSLGSEAGNVTATTSEIQSGISGEVSKLNQLLSNN